MEANNYQREKSDLTSVLTESDGCTQRTVSKSQETELKFSCLKEQFNSSGNIENSKLTTQTNSNWMMPIPAILKLGVEDLTENHLIQVKAELNDKNISKSNSTTVTKESPSVFCDSSNICSKICKKNSTEATTTCSTEIVDVKCVESETLNGAYLSSGSQNTIEQESSKDWAIIPEMKYQYSWSPSTSPNMKGVNFGKTYDKELKTGKKLMDDLKMGSAKNDYEKDLTKRRLTEEKLKSHADKKFKFKEQIDQQAEGNLKKPIPNSGGKITLSDAREIQRRDRLARAAKQKAEFLKKLAEKQK